MGLTASVRPESLLNVWTDYSRASEAFLQLMPNLSACNCHVFVRLQVLIVFYRALCAFFFILLYVVCVCWCVGSQRGPQMMAVLAGNQIDRKPNRKLRGIVNGVITGTPADEIKYHRSAGVRFRQPGRNRVLTSGLHFTAFQDNARRRKKFLELLFDYLDNISSLVSCSQTCVLHSTLYFCSPAPPIGRGAREAKE